MKFTLSSLKGLVVLEFEAGNLSSYIKHHATRWRRVDGAFEMQKDETLPLDPRPEYWFRTSVTTSVTG